MGQVAVVREEQQALGVGIEAADREHARLGGHELDDGRPPVRVARRRDHARRLVQQVVDEVGRCRDRDAVDCDNVAQMLAVGSLVDAEIGAERQQHSRYDAVWRPIFVSAHPSLPSIHQQAA